MRPKAHPSSAEHEVSALATRQGGAVSRRQLMALGVGSDASYTADFCWPNARLIVEADGRSHDTRAGREHDARRDVALQNAGWRVLRFPKRVILGEPAYVADAIRRALQR